MKEQIKQIMISRTEEMQFSMNDDSTRETWKSNVENDISKLNLKYTCIVRCYEPDNEPLCRFAGEVIFDDGSHYNHGFCVLTSKVTVSHFVDEKNYLREII